MARPDPSQRCAAGTLSEEADAIRRWSRQGAEFLEHHDGDLAEIGIILQDEHGSCMTVRNGPECQKMTGTTSALAWRQVGKELAEKVSARTLCCTIAIGVARSDTVKLESELTQASRHGVKSVD